MGSNRLKETARALRDHWFRAESAWGDAVRRRFEERHIAPLEPAVDAAVIGLQKLAQVLDQLHRDCSDRSDLP